MQNLVAIEAIAAFCPKPEAKTEMPLRQFHAHLVLDNSPPLACERVADLLYAQNHHLREDDDAGADINEHPFRGILCLRSLRMHPK
jgi:hypothetical protein